jgi:hypothetical protein
MLGDVRNNCNRIALFGPWDNLDGVRRHGEEIHGIFSAAFRDLSYILSLDEGWRITSH